MMTFLVRFGLNILVFIFGMHVDRVESIWKSHLEDRVVGGRLAGKNEIPYIVALIAVKKDQQMLCGGSIYNERFIITAAHCVRCVKAENLLVVVQALDLTKLDGSETGILGKKIIVHPKYTLNPTFTNDIAIVELSDALVFTNQVEPITLPPPGLESHGRAVIAGYGGEQRRKNDSPKVPGTHRLQILDVVVVPRPECDATFANVSPSQVLENPPPNVSTVDLKPPASVMCAGGLDPAGGTGVCQGDSGGPLLCSRNEGGQVEKYLCGIASMAAGCGLGLPDLYTEVSQFTSWIRNVTGTT